ncbi:uncharacterized protein GGS22DRAFT_188133 [Annulohypoxylon maeteangense]|uniref:uncharacterized protein n=1 Tax=Annulohypoxylon maeteangense TaxID=1927788 RepID=UPI00200821DF|nr:uncharacterized protein GGS22DRAFT_188133 [Annulohypoxylon maeteangense]KAI0885845.1 hypothetical protein GGS22DRAFT_188133 [Annulohypoxylon maeteangense]
MSEILRAKPLDPARWEEHRETISKLYENNGLKKVMSIMLEEYGFEASRAQFERQVRKWKLGKTHTKEEWNAISAIVTSREIGEGSRVLFKGKSIPQLKAQRAVRRHGFVSVIERLTRVEAPPIPPGFIIRAPTPERLIQQCKEWCLDLPFTEFVKFLMREDVYNRLVLRAGTFVNPQLLTASDNSGLDINHDSSSAESQSLQITHRKAITQNFSAFIPTSMLQLDSNKTKGDYNLAYYSMLAFMLTNGMVKLEGEEESESIWSYLDETSAQLLIHFILSTNGWASKELSQKLFDSAILYGRADAVGSMITHPSFDIDINKHVCTHQLRHFTPVEFSSSLGHYAVTFILIQSGADINKSYCRSYPKPGYPYRRGALLCALLSPGDPPSDLVDLLLDHEANVGETTINAAFGINGLGSDQLLSSERSHLVVKLFRKSTHLHHQFFHLGLFHHAISIVTGEVIEEIFDMVYRINNDVDAIDEFKPKYLENIEYSGPTIRTTMRIMDSLAKRGYTELVRKLHTSGCETTDYTLIYAMRSQEVRLVQYLLEVGAQVDVSIESDITEKKTASPGHKIVSTTHVLTPYSEAIRIGNAELCAQLMPKTALQNGDIFQLAAALDAFVETENFQIQRQLLHSIKSTVIIQHYNSSGLYHLDEAIYYCLIKAICQHNDIAQVAFDAWFELLPTNLEFDTHIIASRNMAAFAFHLSLAKRNQHITHLFLQLDMQFLSFPEGEHRGYTYRGYHVDERDAWCLAVQWGDKSILEGLSLLAPNNTAYYHSRYELLDIAIAKGDVVLIEQLLGLGVSASGVDLAAAVRTGNIEIVRFLLEEGTVKTQQALAEAIDKGPDMVDLLLSASVQRKPRLRSNPFPAYSEVQISSNPLCRAIRRNDLPLLKRLIQHGVEIDSPSILEAASLNHEMLDLLLKEISEKFSKGRWSAGTPALCEFIIRNDVDLVGKLLAHHVSLDNFVSFELRDDAYPHKPSMKEYQLPLCVAIDKDTTYNQQIIRAILDSGASKQLNDVVYDSSWGGEIPKCQETALLRAVRRQDLAIIDLLVKNGADINLFVAPRFRRSPLQMAAELGAFEVVRFLLNRGADVNAGPAQYAGGTALQLAAIGGYVGIVELLLKKGADINAKGARMEGRTALEGAAEHGRLDTVALLLKAGVQTTENGRRQYEKAVIFAEDKGHSTVVALLKSHGTGSHIGTPLDPQAENDENQDQTDLFMREVMNMSPTPSTWELN